ncbi:MAG: class I SAM-dependent DNA methyltransferase [Candidatus Gracilibacteria bacterium]|nr:class I SAM-dependent DNA methyltransferase [Candidatus Gracilibacteria bacterium]
MALSWNEIRTRATAFAKEWEDETSEDAEAKSFWDGFFHVFGVDRRRLATFEEAVKKNGQRQGFIDLFWKGVILVEHKSRGRDLDKAFTQAIDYFPGIADYDLPKYILVSDFARFRLYDLETNERYDFDLRELPSKVDLFGFIAGYQKRVFAPEDPVNIKAAELMGKLHDAIKDIGYTGHELEVYLVRILFCLFAEDTGIFDRKLFQEYIEQNTKIDGSDLAYHLSALFQVLNTSREKRLKNIDESLDAFPYVNGKLFEEMLPMASFDTIMRERLLACCRLDWSGISPAIFGSLFQNVMDEKARRNLGAHYTSEKNIMKLISPLFLDDLWEEFKTVKKDKKKLEIFHDKLASLTFLDPACGCGNFLVISYRELRRLEMAVIQVKIKGEQQSLSVGDFIIRVKIDQFYGIEIEEFPSQIAPVAMWLMDHQMNMEVGAKFGNYISMIPLTHRATIVHANALMTDWRTIIAPEKCTYIIGNPPFLGSKMMSEGQRNDLLGVFPTVKNAGTLDFVSAWYAKATDYMRDNPKIHTAFVSTNSIVQGEQVGILGKFLIENRIAINFAHQTFKWSNDAKGNAAVYCVIIGFSYDPIKKKRLFVYEDIKGDAHETGAKNINPYLVDAGNIIITKSKKPISDVPQMDFGNMPNDGGNLILSESEKRFFVEKYPESEAFIREFIGAEEFINKSTRYCFWLEGVPPDQYRQIIELLERIENVKKLRESSSREATRKLALYPSLFGEIRQPKTDYILIPCHSSENRKYIPMGFMDKNIISHNSCQTIPNATLYHFGILTSMMHMAWVHSTCGRLKSDYRYSKDIVYNNFPWPEASEKNQEKIKKLAQTVLDARAEFPTSSLADLYDPRTMPPVLVKAHNELDKAVDKLYRPSGFSNDSERVEWLFGMWEKMVG